MMELNELDGERSLDDLSWMLAPDAGDGCLAALLSGAAERVHGGQPRLGLFHAPDRTRIIQRILLLLPESRARMCDDLVAPAALVSGPAQPVTDEPGLFLWRVDCSGTTAPGVFDALISRVLSRLLITGRPLRHYNCTFMLPLDLRLDDELERSAEDLPWNTISETATVERYRVRTTACLLPELDQQHAVPDADMAYAQARDFLNTHLQDQLFEREPDNRSVDSNIKPTQHYRLRRTLIEHWRLELIETRTTDQAAEVEDRVTAADVDDVSLYRYHNGLLLLAIRVSMPEPLPDQQLGTAGDDWWHALVYSNREVWTAIARRECEHWLRFTKIARLLYASFWEQLKERKIAPLRLRDASTQAVIAERPIRAEFSPIVIDLLRRFLPQLPTTELTRACRLRQVADDRMFVHATYTLCGPAPHTGTPEMGQFERLFSYALYVDQGTDGYAAAEGWAYDPAYTRKLMEHDCLPRWQAIGTLSGFTKASSVFMGFGPFYENPVARVHVPYIYARLQILTLFFRATLDLFDRRIGAATRTLTEPNRRGRPFRRLRADFIRFTNVYWYRHLTPQVQGEELTERMMSKQDLEGTYNLLKDEMERADEYAATELEQWYQDAATWAGQIALLIAVAALAVPAAEMWLGDDGPGALRLASVIALTGLLLVMVWGWLRAKRKKK